MQIGQFTIDVVMDMSKLRAQLAQVQAALGPLNKTMQDFAAATNSVQQTAGQTAQSVQRMNEKNRDAAGISTNLGREMRVLTTSLLGNNVAAIALGTALGNVLTQAAGRAVAAIISFASEMSRLHNELAAITGTMRDVAGSMALVQSVAASSLRPMSELTAEYTSLSRTAAQAGIAQAEVDRIFKEWNKTLESTQIPTLINQLSRLGSAAGNLIETLGRASGATSILQNAAQGLERLTAGLNSLLGMIVPQTRTELQKLTDDLILQNRVIEGLRTNTMNMVEATRLMQAPLFRNATATQFIAALEGGRAQILERINQLITQDPIVRLQALILERNLAETLQNELRTVGMARNEQEIQNRLFQIRLQFLQMGITLSAQQLQLYEGQLRAIQGIQIGVRDQAAAAQNAVNALSGVATNFGNIFFGQFDVLRSGMASWTNEVVTVHTPAFQEAMRLQEEAMRHAGATNAEVFAMKRQLALQEQRLAMDTASMLANTITAIFPKQKGAAIAAAVINTAVAVTRALQLPWPFNWVQAALVAAQGAAQIASIQSTTEKGGSTASVSGGGSAGGGSGGAVTMPTRITIESVDPAAIFTGAQLNGLIDAINSQAENGRIVVASKLV